MGIRGSLPPKYKSGLSSKRDEYPVPPTAVVAGEYNIVAIQVYDHNGRDGFQGAAPALISGDRGILLGGKWGFRTGDRLQWVKRLEDLKSPGVVSFSKQVSADSIGQVTANTAGNSGPLSPAESLKTFTAPGNLELVQQYHGKLFGVEPLQGRVVQSLVEPDRSSFKTTDLNRPITSTDKRFRPVEIKVGPAGAIYVADMYEPLISHRQHFEG